MSIYNNRFTMRDFFMNTSLAGMFPQFDKNDLSNEALSDEKIFSKALEFFSKALNGSIIGNSIALRGSSTDKAAAQLRSVKWIFEGFYDNRENIINNINRNSKIYTTVPSIGYLQSMKDPMEKLKIYGMLFENINYNPDFKSQNSLAVNSALPYSRRQQLWMKKVGYGGSNV